MNESDGWALGTLSVGNGRLSKCDILNKLYSLGIKKIKAVMKYGTQHQSIQGFLPLLLNNQNLLLHLERDGSSLTSES